MSVTVFATRAGVRAAFKPGAAGVPATDDLPPDGSFPELACIRRHVPPAGLAMAEMRAERVGAGADVALVAAGVISEEDYARALAAALETAFEPLDGALRARCPVDDVRLIEGAAAGLLPLAEEEGLTLVLAPRGVAARRIVQIAKDDPRWPKRFRFTTRERMVRFVLRHASATLVARACNRLKDEMPLFSAAAPHRASRIAARVALALVAAAATVAPSATLLALSPILALVFLGWLGLRLISAATEQSRPRPLPAVADIELPIYTIIAALYREARSVEGLLNAIARIDYPIEKLDVILAVEADDLETRSAIARCRSRLPITVIPVPAAAPRTKPKALNAALPFARGAFTVVYDAEDRPEPDQLRRALHAFGRHGDELACVQARLSIDNTSDSWLTRLFTAEYAAHFDVFLNGLSHLGLPLPLGGSSNHFYTDVLRKIGAWDPYNVTEDADLGMRLARLGYRSAVIDSTTYEEAPARLGPWLRQRTRWFKGWMQTWCVHMRQPRRLLRDLGPAGFFAFQFAVGGNVLGALVHPFFLAGAVAFVIAGPPAGEDNETTVAILAALYGINVLVGYFTSVLLAWIGLSRRGLLPTAWILLLTPLNWLLLSIAAWRAAYQFVAAPYRWEKTEHGLAKSSRRIDALVRSLTDLERQLRGKAATSTHSLSKKARERIAALRCTSRQSAHKRRPRARMRGRLDARERSTGLPEDSSAGQSSRSE